MNIASFQQRLALSAHRKSLFVRRSPALNGVKRLRASNPQVKAVVMIFFYLAAFGVLFQASRAEFERSTGVFLNSSALASNNKPKANTAPVKKSASASAKATPTESPADSSTTAHNGLPPYNEENSTAPSANQQYNPSGYAYGHCTYYVAKRRPIPGNWGNARDWVVRAKAAGFSTGKNARVGAIAQTRDGVYGHVAYVEQIQDGKVYVSEYNYVGWNRLSYRWAGENEFTYIY